MCAIFQKQGFPRHLNLYHGIKSRSTIGKTIITDADMKPVFIKQCLDPIEAEDTTSTSDEEGDIATQHTANDANHLSPDDNYLHNDEDFQDMSIIPLRIE